MGVGAGRIGARLAHAVVAGGAMVGIIAASIIGLNDVADDLALASHAPSGPSSGHSVVES